MALVTIPEHTAARNALYYVSYWAQISAMTLGFSLRVAGCRHMPPAGPALVVANHQSFLDPPLVGLAAKREMVYLARKTLFRNPRFAAFIRAYNAVPIDQDGVGKEGIRTVLEQLEKGRAVLIFPEGSRTPDGAMRAFKPGIQLLVKRARVPLVPVGIAGAYHAWPIWRKYPIPAPLFCPAAPGCIAVVVGEPFDSARLAELPRDQALQELFDRIHDVQIQAEKLRRR